MHYDVKNKDNIYTGVYLTKEQSEKMEKCKDKKELMDEYILDYINGTKEDISTTVEAMDEDILMFRAHCIKYGKELKKVKEETCKMSEKLCCDMMDTLYKVREKLNETLNINNKLKNEIGEVKNSLEGVSVYRLEKFLELSNKIMNMSAKEKRIFNFLMTKEGVKAIG